MTCDRRSVLASDDCDYEDDDGGGGAAIDDQRSQHPVITSQTDNGSTNQLDLIILCLNVPPNVK